MLYSHGSLDAIFSQQWFLHILRAFRLIIFIFVTVTRFTTSKKRHALFNSLYIDIRSIWPQIVLEHNRRSTRTRPLRDTLGDYDRESLEMHLEAVIVRTCRP